MKHVLMRGSALGALGLGSLGLAGPAAAADGIKLSLGGWFQTAVLVNLDDHKAGQLGNKRYNDGVFTDGEIYFDGKTTLDDGLTFGAHVELEGEQDNDQIDAAYAFFQGGFGELRVGSQYGALGAFCITPVGGTANFGAFSQDEVINNAFADVGLSAGICNSIDGFRGAEKSQKLVYLSPSFGGFQLSLSWSPNGNHESDGVTDFHSGMPTVIDGELRNVVDVYALYSRDFDGWSLAWGGGGSWTLSNGGNAPPHNKGDAYQTGLNLTFGSFAVGGAFEYYKNGVAPDQNIWSTGLGMAYTFNTFTLGLQYSYTDLQAIGPDINRRVNTLALTGNYAMSQGIALDGTFQYTWANADQTDPGHGGYDSLGIGIGTAFTF